MGELKDWIEKRKRAGASRTQVKEELVQNGYTNAQTKQAVQRVFDDEPNGSGALIILLVVLSIAGALSLYLLLSADSRQKNSVNTSKNSKGADSKKACGTDFSCFISAAKNCQQANMTHTVTMNVFGIKPTTTNRYRIRGSNGSKCILYHEIVNQTYRFSEKVKNQTTPEQQQQRLQQAKQSSNLVRGQHGTCYYTQDELVEKLKSWQAGNASSSFSASIDLDGGAQQVGPEECSGPLYTVNTSGGTWETAEGVTVEE